MSKELVLRSYKKYFFGIASSGGDTGTITWHRMKGFTNGTVNANSTEYNPHYIDDTFESSYLVGISESIDFEFDQMKGDTGLHVEQGRWGKHKRERLTEKQ